MWVGLQKSVIAELMKAEPVRKSNENHGPDGKFSSSSGGSGGGGKTQREITVENKYGNLDHQESQKDGSSKKLADTLAANYDKHKDAITQHNDAQKYHSAEASNAKQLADMSHPRVRANYQLAARNHEVAAKTHWAASDAFKAGKADAQKISDVAKERSEKIKLNPSHM